jgi:hypothetical protein
MEENENLFDCDLEVTSRFIAHAPFEECQEIVPVEFKLVTSDGVVIGQMSGDVVAVVRIDDADLFEVCDADSGGLSHACDALFPRGSSDLHDELNPQHHPVMKMLFLWRAAFLPIVTEEHRMIFMHLIADRFMEPDAVVIMGSSTIDLSAAQLAELGYRKIAGTNFVFCFTCEMNSFSDSFDLDEGGIVVELPVTAAQDFIELWNHECGR